MPFTRTPKIQDRPVCSAPWCVEQIEHDWVFQAPCGHERCASVAWHPLCLMRYREDVEAFLNHQDQIKRQMFGDHNRGPNE